MSTGSRRSAACSAGNQDGERSAAAFQATKLLREAGLTWRELVEAAGARPDEALPEPAESSPWLWRVLVEDCLAARWRLTAWEGEFVTTLASYRHRPTNKQLKLLLQLHAKVRMP